MFGFFRNIKKAWLIYRAEKNCSKIKKRLDFISKYGGEDEAEEIKRILHLYCKNKERRIDKIL